MKESMIERSLIESMRARGGFTRKVVYQGRKGSPDRWCFFPEGGLLILELKRPGEKPDPQQRSELKKLRAAGQYVAWISSCEEVEEVLQDFQLRSFVSFSDRWVL